MSRALHISRGAFGRVALLDMDRSLVRHAHPHCHVLLKIDGDDTKFAVGERIAPLTDSLAVLINAWEAHTYVHDPARRNALILALYIEPRWLRGFRANWIASAAPGFFETPTGEVNGAIRGFAHDLVDAMIVGAATEDLLSALMIAVISAFTSWREPTDTRWRMIPRAPDRRIRKAIETMRADPGANLPADMLARGAGLSRAHFFRLFEQATGVTPHVFLNALKVERAVQAVAGEARLAAVGGALGFGSAAQFSRFFRDHVSVPPREFRAVLAA